MLLLLSLIGGTGCSGAREAADLPGLLDPTPPRRVDALSPWYLVDEGELKLYVDYCGWDVQGAKRVVYREIHHRAIQMIQRSDGPIVFCFFLFDCLYAPGEPPDDVAEQLATALIARKQRLPEQPIALVLDLMHKGWSTRRSPIVRRLREAGIDVFYSERLSTNSATTLALYEQAGEVGQFLDQLTFGLTAALMDGIGAIPLPLPAFDRSPVTVGAVQHAAYLKANHRKVLITTTGGGYEALVTSWNPHNPSAFHENHAIAVGGKPAAYAYAVLRDDMMRCASLGGRYVHWSSASRPQRASYFQNQFPPVPTAMLEADEPQPSHKQPALVCFATEQRIEALVLQMLSEVSQGDEVRIQMFYLSRPAVLHAILDAAKRSGQPVRLLLDPNRTGINYTRDGTPNAQAAAYLLKHAQAEGAPIEIRWYHTRGEQNHAKAMTITNPKTGKYQVVLGSANWTRKNLASINLEANIFVRDAPKITGRFNRLFDRFWFNRGGLEFSAAYDDPTLKYDQHTGMSKWAWRAASSPAHKDQRPTMIEQEFVHW